MVVAGLAVAYRRFSQAYVDAEAEARAAKRGVWQGEFEMPWDYRERHRVKHSKWPRASVLTCRCFASAWRSSPAAHRPPKCRVLLGL
jgi:hypothetical protein